MARLDPQVNIRLPFQLRSWIRREAKRNGSTQTSEIVRAIRERKEQVDRADEYARSRPGSMRLIDPNQSRQLVRGAP